MLKPDGAFESVFWACGFALVAGVDEAGRGAWAGPVAVAAVILPAQRLDWPYRDSKQLSPAQREILAAEVRQGAVCWAVEFAPASEVDEVNVLEATKRAASRAVARLGPAPQALVTDFLKLDTALPLIAPPRADERSFCVAAASLLAKTARDARMRELEEMYPGYGFAKHKGYGAAQHREALDKLGPCPEHRRSFRPVALAQTEFGSRRDN